ncbi:hypothetical protein [Neoaquamicrobium sediminum]|jgi:hypothetical protein|uniref:Uncharacterized protein n=1 Tax=Neoaquamicrobium sediminum TaxID=1849104 RepID=A0ABV3X0Y6_9HYPH|nr:hypothetical protein [Mesorhizobium sediminum]MCV0406840.1 hypothetical protein [Rhizobiaceae bacterium]NRC57152.1 hypothetical protein [Mesorhizobium sediminum]
MTQSATRTNTFDRSATPLSMTDGDSMSFDWDDIAAAYASQPWWVWLAACVIAWLGIR